MHSLSLYMCMTITSSAISSCAFLDQPFPAPIIYIRLRERERERESLRELSLLFGLSISISLLVVSHLNGFSSLCTCVGATQVPPLYTLYSAATVVRFGRPYSLSL